MEKKYTVEVTEVLARRVEVEADTPDEAVELVREMYEAADIVLGADDFISVNVEEILDQDKDFVAWAIARALFYWRFLVCTEQQSIL